MRLKTGCFLGIVCLLAHPSLGWAGDQLKIENIAGGDNVVVVMDSRAPLMIPLGGATMIKCCGPAGSSIWATCLLRADAIRR